MALGLFSRFHFNHSNPSLKPNCLKMILLIDSVLNCELFSVLYINWRLAALHCTKVAYSVSGLRGPDDEAV